MLKIHSLASGDAPSQESRPVWFDLLDPSAEEIAQAATDCGIQIPSRASLQEIETSSRLRAEGAVLFASMPLSLQDESAGFAPVPLGFILSPRLLITVRYSTIHAFARVEESINLVQPKGSAAVFCALIDGMVDFDADGLEKLSGELAAVSARAFSPRAGSSRGNKRHSHALHESLNAVGTGGDHLSRIRESMLGLQRIIGFVLKMAAEWLSPEEKARLSTAQQDLNSLVDFEAHLSSKSQFLLDAILGFINTEQNDIFRVLTIVSVIGIPPTLIASMYGMNFHDMPELRWRWGYPYGLTLIALSALAPILWFKRRGWW
jgi:magnesium transporter